MDGNTPLWIEAMTDEAIFELNYVLGDESWRQGYWKGKTDTKFWKLFEIIVEEASLRNRVRSQELNLK